MAKKKINFTQIAMQVGGTAAGAVGTEIALNAVAPTMSPMMKGLIQIGAGGAAIAFDGGNTLVEGIGHGSIAAGALNLARNFNLLGGGVSGIGADDDTITVDSDWSIDGDNDAMTGDNDAVTGTI